MTKYWFRQKKFGYGATPNSWQGWLLTIASAAATVAVIIAADFERDDATRFLLIAIGLPVILIPTVWIAQIKTEGGWRWRWGEERFAKGERNGSSSAAAPGDDFE